MQKIISGWEDLRGLENHDYKVDVSSRSAVIRPKTRRAKKAFPFGYLSVGAFRPWNCKDTERKLRERGFNVEIESSYI